MIKCISNSPVKEWRISTEEEINAIDITQAELGDIAYCPKTMKAWMFDGTEYTEQK